MILLPRSVKIFVATAPANLHRSFEGLSNEVRCVLAADPLSGHVFLFPEPASHAVEDAGLDAGRISDRAQAP